MDTNTYTRPVKALITVKSFDRIGILNDVALYLDTFRANIICSYAVQLGGSFCCHTIFEAQPEEMDQVRSRLGAALAGLNPEFGYIERDWVKKDETEFVVNLWAPDRRGIVREVSDAIRAANANIEALSSRAYSAPDTGEAIFALDVKAAVESESTADSLYHTFSNLADQQGWTHRFQVVPKWTTPRQMPSRVMRHRKAG